MNFRRQSHRPGTFMWVYGGPFFLAALGLIGLAAALFADGIWNWISWASLGAVTATGLWHALVPARAAPRAIHVDDQTVPPGR